MLDAAAKKVNAKSALHSTTPKRVFPEIIDLLMVFKARLISPGRMVLPSVT